MIALLKSDASASQIDQLVAWFAGQGYHATCTQAGKKTFVVLDEAAAKLDLGLVESQPLVERAVRLSEAYLLVNRKLHPADSQIAVGTAAVGAGAFACIAGPCAVESKAQLHSIATAVKAAGTAILRGGAFKPRTSPYDFQGLAAPGLALLEEAGRDSGLPVASEIMAVRELPLFEHIDLIQVGARNMQNYELLKELGQLDKPILLKRGPANTLDEFLLSAEYIAAGGNSQIILCERGIRGFEPSTRYTLDFSSIPLLKEKSHLPVLVDPSHAMGQARLVPTMALAAVAAGADGLMIEVHNQPEAALCDGMQAILPETFAALMKKITQLRQVLAADNC